MFQSVVVRNFRCFSGLALSQLARVNLIAGKNNTGKTALLEAIHLHCNPGDWQALISVNKVRGVEDPVKDMADVCGWLFYHKHPELGLVAQSTDAKGITRTLTLMILDAATSRERFPDVEKALAPALNASLWLSGGPRLILKYDQPNEPEQVSIAVAGRITGGTGATWIGARIPWSLPCVYLSSAVAASTQDVKFFGELEAAKRQEEMLPSLQILEPRLRKLSLVPLAGEPVIHGDTGLPRLVPVPFMGEGTRRVLSILLAIANARGGVVLIDEIENGLHYSVQQQVWRAIAHAARQNDVQVFATTHSWECIRAADEAFSADETYDLRLHRIDRHDNQLSAVTYTKEMMEAALVTGLEMR